MHSASFLREYVETTDFVRPVQNLLLSITAKCKRADRPTAIYQLLGDQSNTTAELLKVKVKVHTFDIAPLRNKSPPQKRMARVLKGFHSFTCTPTRSSAIGMSHTCLCLSSRSWYSFTDPGGMEG